MSVPTDEAALADAVREARACQMPVEIRGGGSREGHGRPVQAAQILSTAALSGIRAYRPGELSLTAAAGTPLAEVEAAAAESGQMLAFEPPDPRPLFGTADRVPTLGGAVATGLSGPRRIVAGGCRDALTGLRFVNGAGEILRTGGQVMKNVTGYALERLLCGSHGTLGVITEVSLRTAPKPETEATLVFPGLAVARAVEAMSAALGLPQAVSGAAWLPGSGEGTPRMILRVEGFRDSVRVRIAALGAALERFGGAEVVEAEESAALWRDLRDLESFASVPGAVWRVTIRPSRAAAFVAGMEPGGGSVCLLDHGGASVWVRVAEEGEDAGGAEIRRAAAECGGVVELLRASLPVRLTVEPFPPLSEPLARISARLRERFDPDGILNPGRMGG